jgi:ribonuclease R
LPLSKADLLKGRVIAHPDGFGFVALAEGGDDLFLHHKQMRLVFHGDEVLVRRRGSDFRGRPEAAIVEVLQRHTDEVVGRYYRESGLCFVRPDNPRITHDILLLPEQALKPQPGQVVVVKIVKQPSARQLPAGEITEVLGEELDPGIEIDIAVRNHGIPFRWPDEVQTEALAISEKLSEQDLLGRVDLRHLPFVTIDGEDARDFDDAVYCEKKGKQGWTLYVAIADVSHYVAVGSALDEEARKRGTSVYFPGSVVPMLPEKLSNGLCSLNPQVDRLALVCQINLDRSGHIKDYCFLEAVFHSHARLTYTQVGAVIDERHQPESPARMSLSERLPELDALHDLYQVLLKKRKQRGAVEFETTETRILFDAHKKIDRIVPVKRNDAHRLIEECMLAANTCAASLLEKSWAQRKKSGVMFRVHEGPTEKKLTSLHNYLGSLGLSLQGGMKPRPEHYQALLKETEGRPDAHVLQTLLLRSMSQAVYQTENIGHFGLNYPVYTHFTSPIRRYPDLLVHRAIRYLIRHASRATPADVRACLHREKGAPRLSTDQIYPYDSKQMLALAEHCSMTERRADEASRDVENWLKCEYLQDHVGATYRGVVSSVVSFGLFVELSDLYVEGLVHVSTLQNDYYHFDADRLCLIGESRRQVYRLGDEVQVKVVAVSLDERKVDFELVEVLARPGGRLRKTGKTSKRTKKSPTSAKGEKYHRQSDRGRKKSRKQKR